MDARVRPSSSSGSQDGESAVGAGVGPKHGLALTMPCNRPFAPVAEIAAAIRPPPQAAADG